MTRINVESHGKIDIVRLSRPESLNALDSSTFRELKDYFQSATSSAVIIIGEGRCFCAGADLYEMAEMDVKKLHNYLVLAHSVMDAIATFSGLVIAATHGYVLGGGLELALACDWIIAEEKTKFGLPEVTLGLIPGFGGVQRLPQKIGLSQARRLIYTGNSITAKEAFSLGLVDEMTEDKNGLSTALAWAKKALSASFSSAKKVLHVGKNAEKTSFIELFFAPEAQMKIQQFIE